MTEKIRWGILGTGAVARKFAVGLGALLDAELAAVGSRTQERADMFAAEFGVTNRHVGYEALVKDPNVDAVYIATPHSEHVENARLALNAGKPVLCEKPFTLNARQAEELIRLARAKKLLLMEAMWTRYVPAMVRLREMLREGIIGEVRSLQADFGFRKEGTEGRLFDPALGGGALLDVGVYPVSFASMILGKPSEITGEAEVGPTGVDEQNAIVLTHPGGQLALLSSSLRANSFQEASIVGTQGRIRIHRGWWRGADMTLTLDAGGEEFLEFPYTGNGFQFEAAEFMECLRDGRLESSLMPLDETLSILRTMDTLRQRWGVKYPGD